MRGQFCWRRFKRIVYPRTSYLAPRTSNSHSHAAGGAQRGEDSRDDACKNLQECLYAFFLHSRFNFKVKISF